MLNLFGASGTVIRLVAYEATLLTLLLWLCHIFWNTPDTLQEAHILAQSTLLFSVGCQRKAVVLLESCLRN